MRIVCATHRDLHQRVEQGHFRQDLFYRLAQLFVRVPPLRERAEDIRALAMHFLAIAGEDTGPRPISERAIEQLISHDWPGNVRELRNVVNNAASSSAGIVDVADVESAIRAISPRRSARPSEGEVTALVARFGGNISAAARISGIPRSTLRDRFRSEQGVGDKTRAD